MLRLCVCLFVAVKCFNSFLRDSGGGNACAVVVQLFSCLGGPIGICSVLICMLHCPCLVLPLFPLFRALIPVCFYIGMCWPSPLPVYWFVICIRPISFCAVLCSGVLSRNHVRII